MDIHRKQVLLLCLAAPVIALLVNRLRKKKRETRRLRSEKRRQSSHGVLSRMQNELQIEDTESYKLYLRMEDEHFEEILEFVRRDILRQNTNMRASISAEKRLAITLRFLATGETYRSIMFATGVHESTISLLVPEVCKHIYENLKGTYLKFPTGSKEWLKLSEDFEQKWNFPMCIGAMDGIHVKFKPPRSAGNFYHTYKGVHSIVLLGVCDANYKFTYAEVGVNDTKHDAGIFGESSLKSGIDQNLIPFPDDKSLPGQNKLIPYVFVAGDAFPLTKRTMKSYPHRGLTEEKKIYNYKVAAAHRVILNCFGILVNRFKVLLNTINLNPEKVEDITLACCVLHNYLVTKNNKEYIDVDLDLGNSYWSSIQQQQSGNRHTQIALTTRDTFAEYFNEHQTVQDQNNCVED